MATGVPSARLSVSDKAGASRVWLPALLTAMAKRTVSPGTGFGDSADASAVLITAIAGAAPSGATDVASVASTGAPVASVPDRVAAPASGAPRSTSAWVIV